jgi:CubicO group peptidase (beta-lactamase class C family)
MDATYLADRLAELAQRHHVPGASLAFVSDGTVTQAACGVLNTATGVAATTDSLFQIGSITKIYTATLVMRLVEQGKLALDEPVMTYLPKFAVADPEVTRLVTIRHLLTHTSGIDGDYLADTGRGDDCLERYVDGLSEVGQSHALGATMSYCNAGYSILGRVIEVSTGKTWDQALRELLVDPLGLQHTVTLPEEALLYATAVGHVGKPTELRPARQWGFPRCWGPAGLICATPSDVLAFAQLHMSEGVASDGARLLSAATVRSMQEPQGAVPGQWSGGPWGWGLGWGLFDWGGRRVYGHDGETIGQLAFLRIVPDHDVAVVLLTNGGHAEDLYQDLFRELLAELAGVTMQRLPEPPDHPVPVDPARYVGRYERSSERIEVTAANGGLHMTVTTTGPEAELLEEEDRVHDRDLIAVDSARHLFVTRRVKEDTTWIPVVFFKLPDDSAYVHFLYRATPKVG